MRKRIVFFSLLVLTVWTQSAFTQNQVTLRKELSQLNKDFTYRGKPVHPRAIKDLTSWVADPLAGPIAVDVAGTYDSNRYFGDYKVQENGNVFIDLTQENVEDTGWFSYKHLGRLGNGLHVIRTFDNGGGTGVFQSIILVECLLDFEYKSDGGRKSILVIRRRGEFGIGDRYDGKILVDSKHNQITISPDSRNVEKAFTIQVRN
jgi:hypothetical protein